MKTNVQNFNRLLAGLAVAFCLAASSTTGWADDQHLIDGVSGTSFTLTARDGYISTADGNSVYFWGYGKDSGPAQYSGPTLVVNEGAVVTVKLYNRLPAPVSLVFPGQKVTATGGAAGLLTQEVPKATGTLAEGPVEYTFTATKPGTYMYHSGTQPDLQTEMGLVGALIVRPTGFDPAVRTTWKAYGHDDSKFDLEFLFLLTEMDENIHDQVELQVKKSQPVAVDMTKWWPVYWFINGRTAPDTMFPTNVNWLPSQPYDCMPVFHPGQKVMMRLVGGGRDPHPFHHHGNHSRIIARDGRLLSSGESGAGADLSHEVFTVSTTPGGTIDAIYTWTGKGLGWDVYGHTNANQKLADFEDPDSHGKPFPVMLPPDQDLAFGQMYSGSPFLGTESALPPGQGGFNPSAGFMFMWHSHAEKEIVNNNLFPGGMLTMALIRAYAH